MKTQNVGVNSSPNRVTPIIPAKTAVPSDCRISAPAPTATVSGRTPKMKANRAWASPAPTAPVHQNPCACRYDRSPAKLSPRSGPGSSPPALAERACANDGRAPVILERTRHEFGGRAAIDQHDDRLGLGEVAPARIEPLGFLGVGVCRALCRH